MCEDPGDASAAAAATVLATTAAAAAYSVCLDHPTAGYHDTSRYPSLATLTNFPAAEALCTAGISEPLERPSVRSPPRLSQGPQPEATTAGKAVVSTPPTSGPWPIGSSPPPSVPPPPRRCDMSTSHPPVCKDGLVALSPFPIHSSYVIKEKIGQGTWGSVHAAVERTSGLKRAVKKIPKRFANELNRFRQEITFLRCLDHPNIVRLYETFEDYANIYMVMEYCRGGELFDRVAASSTFSEQVAARLSHQILSAICYIHAKNIAHRDVKPENFLFLSYSVSAPMKLIDFGLAKRFHARRQLRTRVGTLYYVSPEVLHGAYNEKCDVWSAGVIVYLLLCGTPPFNGPTDACIINAIREGKVRFSGKAWRRLTPLAKDLVQQLLNRDADARPSGEQALTHPWFQLFSPTPLGGASLLPIHPISLPVPPRRPNCDPVFPGEQQSRPPSLSQYADPSAAPFSHLLSTASSTDRRAGAGAGCCELSVVGVHSPLCSSRVRVDPHLLSPHLLSVPHFVQFSDMTPAEYKAAAASLAYSEMLQHQLPCFEDLSSTVSSTVRVDDHAETWRHLIKQLLPRWQWFAQQDQLKKAALRVIAQHSYDGDEDMQALRSLFLALDSKNDGGLSSDELLTGIQTLQSDAPQGPLARGLPRLDPERASIPNNDGGGFDKAAVVLQNAPAVEKNEKDDGSGTMIETSAARDPSTSPARDHTDHGIMESMTLTEYQDLVNAMSLDGSDMLDYSEFIAASMGPKHYTHIATLRASFRVFDRDGDGKINPSELKAALGWADTYNQDSALYGRGGTAATSKAAIDRELNQIMEMWDQDEDGLISFEDFVATIKQQPPVSPTVTET